MKDFAKLYYELDQTNKTNEKVEILKQYFLNAGDSDRKWALALFSGKRPKRAINTTLLRKYAAEYAGIPDWLFDECYTTVGDLSETISLLLPPPKDTQEQSLTYWIEYNISLAKMSEQERKDALFYAWDHMSAGERFVFSKISSSTFRIGISGNLVVRAISQAFNLEANVVTHRLMGKWNENQISFDELIFNHSNRDALSLPYPFCLAYPLESNVNELGRPEDWQAEWKWDGIRGQIIKRQGQVFIWSRGEDLMTDKFPELTALAIDIPDGTVIDGEILPHSQGRVLTFNALQTRIGRKNLSAKVLKETPVMMYCYDLLEYQGEDIRMWPLVERVSKLRELINEIGHPGELGLPPEISFKHWEELTEVRLKSREVMSEGLMLKRKNSIYHTGRKKGDWWKWKIEPMNIDAVMIYAQRGSGRRANLYTDYTFAVWSNGELIPFAKAYSGLTDKEILSVDKWIKQNTLERFGPVRTVKPELVFEIGFEGIQRSARHKSGIALRFPRILRWREDKKAADADSLETLISILEMYEKGGHK